MVVLVHNEQEGPWAELRDAAAFAAQMGCNELAIARGLTAAAGMARTLGSKQYGFNSALGMLWARMSSSRGRAEYKRRTASK